jgi:hypothetical protein
MRSDISDGYHGTVRFKGNDIVCADKEEVFYYIRLELT